MVVCSIVLIAFAISPAASSAVRNLASISTCRASEFTCLDGTCIRAGAVCDTYWDCPDGSDESSCYSSANSNLTEASVSHERYKRQSPCGLYKWRCADGTCIAVDGMCDGKIDCPDRSDETHARCRNIKCRRNLFRCTYGACVDGTAPCNNVVECADQSDELLPSCRNDTSLRNGKFQCLDGTAIPASDHCDGVPNCPDGSDETVRACAAQKCPAHLFQCAYGACVDSDADCNGRKECADGSDESVELCNRILPANTITTRPTAPGKCLLPPYPQHGTYVATNAPYATPGQSIDYAQLNVTCEQGYGVVGNAVPYCLDGNWFIPIQKCVPFCRLDPDVSVRYNCQVPGTDGHRICNQFEPSETFVKPECNAPNYSSRDLLSMTCGSNGHWNRIIKCKPVCGRVTPYADGLIGGGTEAIRGELPWHVAIYRKPTQRKRDYEQICGGSLVSNRIVISAAHCFWNKAKSEKQAASKYAVATAKLFREWDHEDDKDAQKSEIKSIELSPYYQGARANFQHDIAILILETPFEYFTYVRPVCLDFETDFNRRQLQVGHFGKVAGWGLTAENGPASPVLKVVKLPIVSITDCIRMTPPSFTESITGDKICAGYNNGTGVVCKGDSGGGLSFPEIERGTTTYYLRGVVSTAPRVSQECNIFTVTTFTEIYQHKDFINQFL